MAKLKRSVAWHIALIVGFWVALSIVAWLNLLPWMPRAPTQWLAVVILGPLIILGAEYLGDKLFEAQFLSRPPPWLRISALRTGLLSALLLGAATVSAGSEKASIKFLSRTEASAALTDSGQGYYGMMQLADMRAKTSLPLKNLDLATARKVTAQAYAVATEDFTEDERTALREAIVAMQPMLLLRAPLYARTLWSFIKMKATIEGGLSYSRGDSIVVSDNRLRTILTERAKAGPGQPSEVWVFLLHEQTHVLERKYPQLFVDLYTDVFGFRRAQVTLPEWLRLRRAINPDAPMVEWIYPLGQGAARHWILPDVELRELNHPKMPADFEMVALGVHQVEAGHWAIDDVQQPAASTDLASLPEYVAAFPVKGLIFHPAEIAAEMLAEIIHGGPKVSPNHELWNKTTLWAADALR